jgi:hypothetical protein
MATLAPSDPVSVKEVAAPIVHPVPVCRYHLSNNLNAMTAMLLKQSLDESYRASKSCGLSQVWQPVEFVSDDEVAYQSSELFPIVSLTTMLVFFNLIK